jgi:uracil phosphoribosyltransferase
MNPVIHVDHPLVEHHLCVVRDAATKPSEFRSAIGRLSMFLGVRATEDLQTEPITVRTPLADAPSHRLAVQIGIVPILRAGLGMVDPLMVLLPDSQVWHLGLYRDEETAEPVSYYDRLPPGGAPDVALVLDPMLATGGSIELAVHRLRHWGVNDIRIVSIIASQPGLDRIMKLGTDVRIYVAAIDPMLDERSYIVPGLGDAGDRIFDTPRI